VLADYGCARSGTHVFFFLKRHIVYGGQISGSQKHGAFCLNGSHSPLGKKANAPLVWDESKRTKYRSTETAGVFRRPQINAIEVTQPYLILFEDKLGLKGRSVLSDDLYFEIGEFPYPLPTNSISGMGFCTMTPAEVSCCLRLLQREPTRPFDIQSDERVFLLQKPLAFSPEFGLSALKDAESESHAEASCLCNPNLLPSELRPDTATLCRQVPISPFKPFQMDRADICYYFEEPIAGGSIPNVIIELKNKRFGRAGANQVLRYAKWLRRRVRDDAERIMIYALAPSFTEDWNSEVPVEYKDQIKPATF
jgi:hypothetical protein